MDTRFQVIALGFPVDIIVTGITATDAANLRAAWSRLVAAEPVRAVATIETEYSEAGWGYLTERLVQRVTLAAIEAARGDLLMLHAGAVAHEDGRTIVLVGPSGRGKTTATTVLARRFGYVTDETVGIAADLSIARYDKPLSVVSPTGPKRQVSPDELELVTAPAPLHAHAILLLDRSDDAPLEPVLEPVGLAEAISELIPQSSALPALDGGLTRLASVVAAVGGIRRLHYRESDRLDSVIAGLFENREDVPENWDDVPGRSNAIENGEQVIVLRDSVVRVLDGIGATVWLHHGPIEHLTAAVLAKHGPPPSGDAAELIARAAAELRAAGL